MEKIVISEELRQKLLNVLPVNKETTFDFEPKTIFDGKNLSEEDLAKVQPKFLLKPFSISMFDKIQTDISKAANAKKPESIYSQLKRIKTYIAESILGWDNYIDLGTMTTIDYSETTKTTVIDAMTPDLITEIFTEINRITGNGTDEVEEKEPSQFEALEALVEDGKLDEAQELFDSILEE